DATPLLKVYARWRLRRLARQDAVAEQQRQLLRLLRRGATTRFGREHGFGQLRSVAHYQAAGPLRRYQGVLPNHLPSEQRQLLRLLRRGATTRFGREHGFGKLRSVADYQAAVPLRRYEEFWQIYWQSGYPQLRDVTWPGTMPYFALSSGTSSGVTKYIPV